MLTEFQLSFADILAVLTVFQYLVIASFLLANRAARSSGSHILAFFFVLLGVNVFDGMLMIRGFFLDFPSLALFEDSFVLTYGPMLYFYTRKILAPHVDWTRRDGLHLLPFLLVLALTMGYYHTRTQDAQLDIIRSIMSYQLPSVGRFVVPAALLLHFLLYVVYCLRRIDDFHASLRESYSNLQLVNVRWLSFTLYVISIAFCVSFLSTVLSAIDLILWSQLALVGVLVVLLYYINAFVMASIRNPRLFVSTDVAPEQKTVAISFTEQEKAAIAAQLDELTVHRFFIDPNLTIDTLAEKAATAPRRMSQYLNEVRGQNFYDYVNGLRIDEAQRLLITHRDLTIQQVMYEVGFRSKSSFNTVFRQQTGNTPGEFRKSRPNS